MKNKDYVLIDKKSIFIDEQVKIGKNVIIYENNRIEGESVIGDNVTIFPNSYISNSIIGKGSKIYSSFIEKSIVRERCFVGVFCHLKNAKISKGTKLPSFSEIKDNRK